MCRDFYVTHCLIIIFFFLCYIVGYPRQRSFHLFLLCLMCPFLWNCAIFLCRVKGVFPIKVCWFLLWHGRGFVLWSCVDFFFGIKGDLLPNLSMCLSRWSHHFLRALWIFFVASNGSWSFYNFIATFLICHCCCNFFLVPFDFLSLLSLLILICFLLFITL